MDCAEENVTVLPAGTELLRGQYRITRSLGQGGFGLTYLARDSLNRVVVIKECFPEQICHRVGAQVVPSGPESAPFFASVLEQFQAEAHQLAELDHPRIVGVHQTFAENGTAYTAMDFVEGVDLHELVDHAPGRLTPTLVNKLLRQVLDALSYLHDRGVLHRDVAPDNLILSANGDVTLIDFGAAYSSGEAEGGQSQRMLAVKDGYSPPEFYCADGVQGAYSDLYSMGALCHLVFTGEAPPDAQTRLETVDAGRMDPYVPLESTDFEIDIRLKLATDRALALEPKDRLRCADDWLAVMDGPIPKPLAVFDPAVIGVIEELVSKTNKVLTPGLPKALQKPLKVLEEARQVPPPPKQYVDIFGDPIDDVEAYLKEQDRLCKARARTPTRLLQQGDFLRRPSSEGPEAPAPPKPDGESLLHKFRDRLKGDRSNPNTRLFLI
ncbi:serine/threonine-protein kinase [uncultured Shimia sp.]|uniref:serine/threonine protein kinase n=1 Tax=uncultured Shimia sp. TaxID=573152 RepID=UPI0026026FF4|nr:serine/threonine-protein kinase [uncultured Shimia sp.]